MTDQHRIEDFHFGAPVHSSDGVHIGALQRVIVDHESLDVHAIVAKETRRFSGHHFAGTGLIEDDIAVPVTAVVAASRESILLSETSAEVRRHGPYLTYQYAPLAGRDVARMGLAVATATPYIPHLIEEAHKSQAELEIRRGENVMLGRSGKRLGTARDVVMDAAELVGIVVHPDGFFKEDVLLQVRFLGRSDDLALFAHLTPADLEHLTPFHPGSPA